MNTLCIQWPHLGPYHVARLSHLAKYCATKDVEVVALETATTDATYAWDFQKRPDEFAHVCLFPDANFHELKPRAIHQKVFENLSELNPDVVAIHSYSFPDARAALLWAKRHEKGTILMFDSKKDDAPRSNFREFIKSQIVSSFDAALAAGTPQSDYLEELGMSQAHIFHGYDVVDNDFFALNAGYARERPETVRHLPGLGDPQPYFLASNRFIPRKNLLFLLRGYGDYRGRTSRPWKLIMLGDGPERADLERFVTQNKIEGVVFPGFRKLEELPAYYAFAGSFIHPAGQDMWGLVVNEAMACGLPVIVSTTTGCAEDLVRGKEVGFLFHPDDRAALVGHMVSISEDEALRQRLSQNAVKEISKWTLSLFSENMHRAAEMAHDSEKKPLSPLASLFLKGLALVSRRPDSFHAIPEEKAV